jgi:glycogen debranching enzyme
MKHERPPEEAIRVEDRWYVLATAPGSGEAPRVLKHGECFALFDRFGDVPRAGSGEHGFYYQGTRFLSRLELRVNGQRPMLLGSSVRRDNLVLTVDGTNADIFDAGELAVLKGSVHLSRRWLLGDACAFSRIRLQNFGSHAVRLRLAIEYEADFADIFEVRGVERAERGTIRPPELHADGTALDYEGLDGVTRRLEVALAPRPTNVAGQRADYEIALEPGQPFELDVRFDFSADGVRSAVSGFGEQLERAEAELAATRHGQARARSANEQFNAWIERSAADLAMLCAGNPESGYPYAGVPWYSVPFGRDGILTAMHYLWVDPRMARGVLDFLAANQAEGTDPARDAEPGKIVHEMRKGELAALGEIPFGRYYGTIDATPLFVILAGEYHQRTGDLATVKRLWPAIERAVEWIRRYGDVDGDGYVEYQRATERGLANQGWKDSEDSIFHADGRLAIGPIALAEVQAYVYLAQRHAARLATWLGRDDAATRLEREAATLQAAFERDFWCESLGTYAIALDGDKQPCRVRSSNAGHVLWSGIASAERAARTGATLLSPESFSGWGVRTIARGEARYNPMSYHNGSIWPHDNAMVAMGLARYGMKEQAVAILEALHEASQYMDLHRLPELYCGFERAGPGEGPILYPVACSPQAWASSAPFYLLKACLGLTFDPQAPRIRFVRPQLPRFLDRLQLTGLQVGEARVDVVFERHGADVAVRVTRQEGEVDVSVVL